MKIATMASSAFNYCPLENTMREHIEYGFWKPFYPDSGTPCKIYRGVRPSMKIVVLADDPGKIRADQVIKSNLKFSEVEYCASRYFLPDIRNFGGNPNNFYEVDHVAEFREVVDSHGEKKQRYKCGKQPFEDSIGKSIRQDFHECLWREGVQLFFLNNRVYSAESVLSSDGIVLDRFLVWADCWEKDRRRDRDGNLLPVDEVKDILFDGRLSDQVPWTECGLQPGYVPRQDLSLIGASFYVQGERK